MTIFVIGQIIIDILLLCGLGVVIVVLMAIRDSYKDIVNMLSKKRD